MTSSSFRRRDSQANTSVPITRTKRKRYLWSALICPPYRTTGWHTYTIFINTAGISFSPLIKGFPLINHLASLCKGYIWNRNYINPTIRIITKQVALLVILISLCMPSPLICSIALSNPLGSRYYVNSTYYLICVVYQGFFQVDFFHHL